MLSQLRRTSRYITPTDGSRRTADALSILVESRSVKLGKTLQAGEFISTNQTGVLICLRCSADASPRGLSKAMQRSQSLPLSRARVMNIRLASIRHSVALQTRPSVCSFSATSEGRGTNPSDAKTPFSAVAHPSQSWTPSRFPGLACRSQRDSTAMQLVPAGTVLRQQMGKIFCGVSVEDSPSCRGRLVERRSDCLGFSLRRNLRRSHRGSGRLTGSKRCNRSCHRTSNEFASGVINNCRVSPA